MGLLKQRETSDIELVVKSGGFKKSFYLHKLILAGGAAEFAKLLPSKETVTVDLDVLFPPEIVKDKKPQPQGETRQGEVELGSKKGKGKGKEVSKEAEPADSEEGEEEKEEKEETEEKEKDQKDEEPKVTPQQEKEPAPITFFTKFLALLYGAEFSVDKGIPQNNGILKAHIEEVVALYRLSGYYKATTLLVSFEAVFLEFAEPFVANKQTYIPDEDSTPQITRGSGTTPSFGTFTVSSAPKGNPDAFSGFVKSFAIPVLLSAIIIRSKKVQAIYSRLFENLDWVLLNHQELIKRLDAATFIDIFSDDLLLVNDEFVVFDCATKWLEAHSNQDEKDIMGTIRFPFMKAAHLIELKGSGILSKEDYTYCLEVQALDRQGGSSTVTPPRPGGLNRGLRSQCGAPLPPAHS